MGERMVGEAEAAGREGMAWLLGVASLRREALSRAAQVLAWVRAVEVQRGEARDEAAAAEQRCDELEQEVAKLRHGEKYWREVAEELKMAAGKVAAKLHERERELEQLRGGGAA